MIQKCFLLLLAIFSYSNLFTQATDEEAAVRATLMDYIEGRNFGNPDQLKDAFHPMADLRHVKEDALRIWPSKDYIGGVTPGKKHNCVARIVYVDIKGNAAQAKIEIEYPNWKYADYLNLLKIKGEWVIAVKSFAGGPIKAERVLFVLTSNEKMGNTGRWTGFHLGEVSHVYKPIHDAGYEIDFVSPKGGKTKMYGMDMNDPMSLWMIQDPTAYYKLSNAMTPEEIDPTKYKAIYYVGGSGTMWDLPDNKAISDIAAQIYEADGLVSAVCHGPAGLVNIQLSNGDYLVKGKKLTAFTNQEETAARQADIVPFLLESKLKERGAVFSGADNWQENVVVDGRLITGQNPASAYAVALEIIKRLQAAN